MKRYFIILCLSLFTTISLGQDRDSVISEIDSIREFGIDKLKEYIINRVECHRKNLYSSNLFLMQCNDCILINDKNIDIDYSDSNLKNCFGELLRNLIIKEIIWTKSNLNDSAGWISIINIKAIENEQALIERIPFNKFEIDVSQVGHKIEKRKKNGKLVEKYEELVISHNISNLIYKFEESEMESDEMIVWTIYGRKSIKLGFHLK